MAAALLVCLFACKTPASRESFPFEDVSKQVGIDFWQYSGATGEMLLPEIGRIGRSAIRLR